MPAARLIASVQDELADNRKAWEMRKNGKYRRVKRDMPALNSQEERILGPASLDQEMDEDDDE